ncbi:MAG: Gfo/Idh/MocA family protein [Candidatus Hodarchaeales archaeon]|jgi:predicted dehydrogenase
MLKIGILGLGNNGSLHMLNSLNMKDIHIEAVADKSKRNLNKAKSQGIKNVYDDYTKLIQNYPDLDAVIISLPNFLHYDSVKLSLENGINVFVEKPMATSIEHCKDIVKLEKKSGRSVMVGHCVRFYDAIQKIKKLEERGEIGNLEFVTTELLGNGPFAHAAVPKPVPEWWFYQKSTGGGALLDIGYHLIDLFRYFAGEPKVLFSHLDHKYNLPIEDGANLILQTKNPNIKGFINVGWYQKLIFPQYNFRCILHGKSGHLNSEQFIPKNMYTHAVKEGIKNFISRVTGRKIKILSYTYFYNAYYQELRHFFDSIQTDEKPSISAYDGLKTFEVINDVYNAAQQIE